MTGVTIAEARSTRRVRTTGAAALFMAVFMLSGCEAARLAGAPSTPAPPEAAAPPAPRASSASGGANPLVNFYADVEGGLTASGRMRRETAPADAPFTLDDLVRNFERIAFYDEYVDVAGRYVQRETPALLRRWERPARVGMVIGPSVPPADAARDRAEVTDFTERLARLTGLDMATTEGPDANFLVMILSSSEQAVAAQITAERFPGFEPGALGALGVTPSDLFCITYAFSEPDRPSAYAEVLVLIRAEHPPLTQASCVQEEMAQAMGLPNDSPDARPSLFNDSLEFAFLTEHDEILLRMLYDPRLRPGMTAAEARPLLPAIARDALAAQAGERLAGLPLN